MSRTEDINIDQGTETEVDNTTVIIPKPETFTRAGNSNEFLNMNNLASSAKKNLNFDMINSNKASDIFSFGEEDPDLLNRFGHLLGMRRLVNLKKELASGNSHYFFPTENPFALSVSEYEDMPCRLNYSNDFSAVKVILKNINKSFLNEVSSLVSIAFQVDKDSESKTTIKQRDNSIRVVIMLALVNSCDKLNMNDVFAIEAYKNVSFITVFSAICELIDLLRNQVTHVE